MHTRENDIQWKSGLIQAMQRDPSSCMASSAICRVFSPDSQDRLQHVRGAAVPIFHLNQQPYQRGESNPHHLQRLQDNGLHIGLLHPTLKTNLTDCDLDLAGPLGKESDRRAGRSQVLHDPVLFWVIVHPVPWQPSFEETTVVSSASSF